MSRAAILTIVLAFAVGPNTALLCRSWCQPDAAAARGCHHQEPITSASLNATDVCSDGFGPGAFVREDIRRDAAGGASAALAAVRTRADAPLRSASVRPPILRASLDTRRPLVALRV